MTRMAMTKVLAMMLASVVAMVLAMMVASPGQSPVQSLQEPRCDWAGLAGPLRLYQLNVVVEGDPPPGLLLPALVPAAAGLLHALALARGGQRAVARLAGPRRAGHQTPGLRRDGRQVLAGQRGARHQLRPGRQLQLRARHQLQLGRGRRQLHGGGVRQLRAEAAAGAQRGRGRGVGRVARGGGHRAALQLGLDILGRPHVGVQLVQQLLQLLVVPVAAARLGPGATRQLTLGAVCPPQQRAARPQPDVGRGLELRHLRSCLVPSCGSCSCWGPLLDGAAGRVVTLEAELRHSRLITQGGGALGGAAERRQHHALARLARPRRLVDAEVEPGEVAGAVVEEVPGPDAAGDRGVEALVLGERAGGGALPPPAQAQAGLQVQVGGARLRFG